MLKIDKIISESLKEKIYSLFEDWYLYYKRTFYWKSVPEVIESLDGRIYKVKDFIKEAFLSGYTHRYEELQREVFMDYNWIILKNEPENLPETYTTVMVITKHIPLVKSKLGKAKPYIIMPAYLNNDKDWREWYPYPVIDSKIITNLVVGWAYYPNLPEEFK